MFIYIYISGEKLLNGLDRFSEITENRTIPLQLLQTISNQITERLLY